MSGVKKKLIPKIGIILLSISLVSAETLEKNDPPSTGGKNETNCTAECLQDRLKLASRYNERISNGTSSPCNDFYSYACENFNPTIDESIQSGINSFRIDTVTSLAVKVTKQRNEMIEETLNTTDEYLPHKLIKTFYKSCVDYKNKISPASSSDVNFLLQQLSKLGGWPVLEGDNWDEAAFDWKKIVIESTSVDNSFDAFLRFGFQSSTSPDITYYILPSTVDRLPRKLTDRNQTQLNAFYDYMVNVSVLLGANETFARKDLRDALDFELNLTSATNDLKSNSIMSIAQITDRWPSVNWTEFLNNLTQSQIKFDNSTIIEVIDVDFDDNLMKMISGTSKRVQANYGLWRMVRQYVAMINNNSFQQLKDTLDSIIHSDSSSSTINCVKLVNDYLPVGVDALYVKKFVDKRVKIIATDIYKEIKQQLVKLVRSADWLDEETKRKAVEKTENIKGSIAYPDDLVDNLEEYYKDLGELVDGGYLENFIRLKKFNLPQQFEQLKIGVLEYYRTHPIQSLGQLIGFSALYISGINLYEITAGILQSPLFTINYPNYVNYGAIGTGIAHELSHAHGTNARKIDNLLNKSYKWTEESEKEFKNKEECLVEQYSRSIFNGTQVNGNRTLDENVADNVGVKIAYLAYQNWAKQNGPEKSLSGFESFSPNQLFWLAFANMFCVKYTPSGINMTMNQDVHSPDYFRVTLMEKCI